MIVCTLVVWIPRYPEKAILAAALSVIDSKAPAAESPFRAPYWNDLSSFTYLQHGGRSPILRSPGLETRLAVVLAMAR